MKRLLTYVLILMFLLCSCGGRRDSRLAEADRVMEEHPDSALAILEAIDTTTLKDEDNHALHALLLSYACFKNYDVPLNDTLLDVAVSHYSRQLNSAELMKSMFLKATNGIERGEYESAMALLLQAEKISKLRQDTYWQAKIVEREADVLSKSFNFEQASRSYKKAAELYNEAGKIDNHRFSLVDHARTSGNMNKFDYAFHIIDSVYAIAAKEDYMGLKRACVTAKFTLLVDDGRDSEAKHLYYDYPEEETKYLQNSLDLSRVAQIWMNEGDMAKALEYLKKGEALQKSHSDTMSMYYGWSEYNRRIGNLAQTLAYSDSTMEEMAKYQYRILGESAIGQQRDYYEDIYDAEARRVKTLRLTIIAAIFVFLIFVIGGIVLYKYRMRLKRTEVLNLGDDLNRLRVDMSELKSNLEASESQAKSLANKNSTLSEEKERLAAEKEVLSAQKETLSDEKMELFAGQWRVIDSLCESYYENDRLDEEQKLLRISKSIQAQIKKMRTPEFYREIEKYINRSHNDIVKKIKERIPRQKVDDYNLLLLMLAGFSISSTCLLCDIPRSLYYSRRSRWSKDIKEKVEPDLPEVAKDYNKLIMKRPRRADNLLGL